METNEATLFAASAHGCGVERTLDVLDGKWTTLVVRELLGGSRRFGEIRAALGNPSAKTLTDRLRALERQHVLTRTAYAEIPPRVVYELTPHGETLRDVLEAMLRWGDGVSGDLSTKPSSDTPAVRAMAQSD